jgi:hypothetical protein
MSFLLFLGGGSSLPSDLDSGFAEYSTVSNVRYAHQTAPWDAPLSFGVQALIEYNGLVFNDRYQEDRIRVTSITGLDDAEIEDSRDPVPGDHNETPYDAHYRGRTFVLNGRIQAGSLGMLKRLERDLKAAFAPLTESPMKFNWFDVLDTFDDPATMSNYTKIVDFGSVPTTQVAGSSLIVTPGATYSWPFWARTSENRLYGDNQQILKISGPGKLPSRRTFVILKSVTPNTFIAAGLLIQGSATSLVPEIFCYVNGVQQNMATGVTDEYDSTGLSNDLLPTDFGRPLWIRGRIDGDKAIAELWLEEPRDGSVPALAQHWHMAGSAADALGDGVLGRVGFGGIFYPDEPTVIDRYEVQSLYPGDVSFNVRKLSSLSMKDSQDSQTRFARDFQITLRASKFVAESASEMLSETVKPDRYTGSASLLKLGRTYPRTYPLIYNQYAPSSFSARDNILSVNNRGTVFTEPKILFHGPTSGFTIINLTNGQQMSWIGTLTENDYLVFNCDNRKKTVINSIGANQLEFFVATSDWIRLEPGWNDLYVASSGDDFTTSSRLNVFYKHGWM